MNNIKHRSPMTISYSSEGEDVLIRKIFERCYPDLQQGTYVDIGARRHPWINSNTALLHEMGWGGINVDPRPGTEELFHVWRPFDDTYEVAVGGMVGGAWLLHFDRPELNYMVQSLNDAPDELRGSHRTDATWVKTVTPSELLKDVHQVDFLDIDVEGAEEEILKAWPWDRLRPKVICLEDIWPTPDLENVFQCDRDGEPMRLGTGMGTLHEHGYVPVSRLLCSTIYIHKETALWR